MPTKLMLLFFWLLSAACAMEQADDALRQQLRKFEADLLTTARAAPPRLADADLDLLEAAEIDVPRFTPGDVAGIVKILRLGQSLRERDWAPAVAYAVSKDGRALAWPMLILSVQRDHMDDAAQLATAAMRDVPKGQRSYSTWKRWESLFGHRDDAEKLSHEFTLALLLRVERGDEAEQDVVADLLDKPGMTRLEVPALRDEIAKKWRQHEAETASSKPATHPSGKVWIEDRKGLRQVAGKAVRHVERWEIRLQRPAPPGATAEPWGILMRRDTADGEQILAKHAVFCSLAAAAHDNAADLDPGIGPIAVILRPDEEPTALSMRIEDLDERLTAALAAGGMAIALADHEEGVDAGKTERAQAIGKQVLAAVRLAARRLRELTLVTAGHAPPDAAGDNEATQALGKATVDATAWIDAFVAQAPPPANGGSWRDMLCSKSPTSVDRTHVLVAKDSMTIVVFSTWQGASDVPGTRRGTMIVTLKREDLRGAEYGSDDAHATSEGVRTLAVTTSRPLWRQWLTVLPANSSGVMYLSSADSAVRGGRQDTVWIPCDTDEHRQELIAELQRFAAADGR